MSIKDRMIPPAMNRKEKIYHVQLAAPIWSLKRESQSIMCYIKNAPNGRYLVYNSVVKSAGRSFEISTQPIIVTNGEKSTFQILIRNVEADYRGDLSFQINEIIAEAVSF